MTSWAIRRKSDGKFFRGWHLAESFTENPLKTYRTLGHAKSGLSNALYYHHSNGDYEIVRLDVKVVAVE